MIIPKHLFRELQGRQIARRAGEPGAGRHRPYLFVDFKPGDLVQGKLNPNYHHAQPAVFRHDRDEGRRRRGVGGARGAADRRIRFRLEHAGRGRDPEAPGGRAARATSRSSPPATSSISSSTTPTPGRRSTASGRASRRSIPFLTDPAVRQALNLLVDRASVQKFIYGRTGKATANFINNPPSSSCRRTRTTSSTSTRRSSCWTRPAGSPAPTACGKRRRQAARVYQTSINAPRQKTQEIVKQACQKAGIDRDQDRPGLGLFLLGCREPGHLFANSTRHPDVHDDDDAARSGRVHAAVPVVGGRHQGEQMAGPQHHPLAERRLRQAVPPGRRTRLDPVKRAALFIAMNDLVIKERGGHPGRLPPERGGG
jgi:peptide/nickel transport system substrate-binding protein